MLPNYDKQYIALKYYLLGREYYTALKSLDFAHSLHTGKRKDGTTPEFHHQLGIALYVSTLKDLRDEQLALTTSLLHDVMEDYNVPYVVLEHKFGKEVSDPVWRLTKKFEGEKKNPLDYFRSISECPIASIVKGADRTNNLQTMAGVFSKEKQLQYIEEVEVHFLPMLKRAKYTFPEQTSAYFNIIHLLKSQVDLLRTTH